MADRSVGAADSPEPDPVTAAAAECRDRFGEPQIVASAPGRVNLVGGHTDYNEGLVLPVTIDRRTAVAARPRRDDILRIHSLAVADTVAVPLDDPSHGTPQWATYGTGVGWSLVAEGLPVCGTDLVVATTIPIGGGLASSAAYEVATAFALLAIAGEDPGAERAAIAEACRKAETEVVGVPCGPMDQLMAVFGEADHALLLDCRTREREPLGLPSDLAVLVVDSNVTHELADSAYADRREACERGVDLLAQRLGDVQSLRDVNPTRFAAHADLLPEPIRSRCRHVVEENERVRTAAQALRVGDHTAVGQQLTASHESLRDDFDVSCAELDRLVELLDREGVYGARMTGGGFGGCVVALVERSVADHVARSVATEYEASTGIEADAYITRPSAGARLDHRDGSRPTVR